VQEQTGCAHFSPFAVVISLHLAFAQPYTVDGRI
jgi:hypothetical protein